MINCKAIILAGGQGKRLRPLTNNNPKCMVKIFDRSILEHQINCFRECGINDITVVTGYRSEKIKFKNINYVKNKNYKKTNMVYGLFLAKEKLNGIVIISYGDIVYEKKILKRLVREKNDISITVDRNWKKLWELRFDNPLSDAESLRLDKNGFITDIGRKVEKIEDIQGQYIGLMKFQNAGLELLKSWYEKFGLESRSKNNVLNSKLSFESSFMTDLLQTLIKQGCKLKSVTISGGWLEIDTLKDYKLYHKLSLEGKISQFFKI